MNSLTLNALILNGGKGSGNFGHGGRPGMVGGSGKGKGGSSDSGDLDAKKKELRATKRKIEKLRSTGGGGVSEMIALKGKASKLEKEIKDAETSKGKSATKAEDDAYESRMKARELSEKAKKSKEYDEDEAEELYQDLKKQRDEASKKFKETHEQKWSEAEKYAAAGMKDLESMSSDPSYAAKSPKKKARASVKDVLKKGGSYDDAPEKDAYSLADQLSSGKEYGLGKAFKDSDAGKAYEKIQTEVGGDHGAEGYAKIAKESFGGNNGKETSKQLEAKRKEAHKALEEYAKSASSNEEEHKAVKEFFDGLIDEYYDNYGANGKK